MVTGKEQPAGSLEDLHAIIESRSKSRRVRFSQDALSQGYDSSSNMPYIQLEIGVNTTAFHARLKIWADRWCQVAFWRDIPGGKRYTSELQGRVTGELFSRKLYERFLESSERLGTHLGSGAMLKEEKRWKEILKSGPR